MYFERAIAKGHRRAMLKLGLLIFEKDENLHVQFHIGELQQLQGMRTL